PAAERLGRDIGGRVPARLLHRRQHCSTETVFVCTAARGGVWEEGLPTINGGAQYVSPVSITRRNPGTRNRTRRERSGLVVTQPLPERRRTCGSRHLVCHAAANAATRAAGRLHAPTARTRCQQGAG